MACWVLYGLGRWEAQRSGRGGWTRSAGVGREWGRRWWADQQQQQKVEQKKQRQQQQWEAPPPPDQGPQAAPPRPQK